MKISVGHALFICLLVICASALALGAVIPVR